MKESKKPSSCRTFRKRTLYCVCFGLWSKRVKSLTCAVSYSNWVCGWRFGSKKKGTHGNAHDRVVDVHDIYLFSWLILRCSMLTNDGQLECMYMAWTIFSTLNLYCIKISLKCIVVLSCGTIELFCKCSHTWYYVKLSCSYVAGLTLSTFIYKRLYLESYVSKLMRDTRCDAQQSDTEQVVVELRNYVGPWSKQRTGKHEMRPINLQKFEK